MGSHGARVLGQELHRLVALTQDTPAATNDPVETQDSLSTILVDWARTKRWWPLRPDQGGKVKHLYPLGRSRDTDGDQSAWIATVQTDDPRVLVQIPLLFMQIDSRIAHNLAGDSMLGQLSILGRLDEQLVIDGTAQAEFWKAWMSHATISPVAHAIVKDPQEFLQRSASSVRALDVEQSNSSVLLLGTERPLIAKVFRVLHPGIHPEVELPSALGDWSGVGALWAHYEIDLNGPGLESAGDCGAMACSAVVSDAVKDAEDGFVTVRSLASKGADPTEVATEIGVLTAQMHDRLESTLGSVEGRGRQDLRERLEAALRTTVATTDELSFEDVNRLQQMIEVVTADEDAPATRAIRVHGDLHLGQLLHGSNSNWKVVDFEGEPLRGLDERRLPDLPARDIAGMLRSFDYASESDGIADSAWLETARNAFLDGYQSVRPLSNDEMVTIRAYELYKVLYELQYEVRFRPQWIRIPLAGMRRLMANTIGPQDQDGQTFTITYPNRDSTP